MFNLDEIEQDYLKNSFRLSEGEIIQIYQEEGATLSVYEEELEDYCKKINNMYKYSGTAEERLLHRIFEPERMRLLEEQIQKIPTPKKRHLSKESQKKVIEGSLYIVFDSTREWYNFFEGKISMEKLYYICLESLFNSVKYMTHCEDPVFELYVLKSIERSMIKYVSNKLHISYRRAYEIIKNINDEERHIPFYYEIKEEPEKPSKIFYSLRNEHFNIDYIKDISSEEFLVDYIKALEMLDEDERIVMQLSYDIYGCRGLTIKEIANYLGIKNSKVSSVKRRAIKKLSANEKLNSYIV